MKVKRKIRYYKKGKVMTREVEGHIINIKTPFNFIAFLYYCEDLEE